MTELERMKERMPTRRAVLRRSALFTAGLLAGQTLEITALEPLKEHFEPVPRSKACSTLRPERFDALGSVEMKAALMCWQRGRRHFPSVIAERCTRTYRGSDGRRWMKEQGERITLFGDRPFTARDIPMADQPDGELGEWAAQRLDQCELGGEPVLQKCRVLVKTDQGIEPKEWLALMLPWEDGTVDSVTRRA